MPHKLDHIAVLDIGKTNVKLHVLDANLHSVAVESIPNTVKAAPPYPHFETAKTWDWLTRTLGVFAADYSVGAINISAHGAAAALIDAGVSPELDGLVLPIMDYEFSGPDSLRSEYDQFRSGFETTFSPRLPAGLNLGAQLFWQSRHFSEEFAAATHILPYPQYWAWRMSGELCSEVTSLGCHTDLWCPALGTWSSLAKEFGWADRFPSLTSAWQSVTTIHPNFAEKTGLDLSCRVFPGIHDSNASFARYLWKKDAAPFAVVSTGTWAIAMASGTSLKTLDAERDMLANVDAMGRPVTCARSMGGREFGAICERLGANTDALILESDILQIFSHKTIALPDFSGGSGPFGGHVGKIIHEFQGLNGTALATLYAALMIDLKLDLLRAEGDVFIEGPFADNEMLCALIAQLRPHQHILASRDKTGTVVGCAQLTLGTVADPSEQSTRINGRAISGLNSYREVWRKNLPVYSTIRSD